MLQLGLFIGIGTNKKKHVFELFLYSFLKNYLEFYNPSATPKDQLEDTYRLILQSGIRNVSMLVTNRWAYTQPIDGRLSSSQTGYFIKGGVYVKANYGFLAPIFRFFGQLLSCELMS